MDTNLVIAFSQTIADLKARLYNALDEADRRDRGAQAYGMDRLTYGDYVNVIQDRIDLVNMKAAR